ncbi:MAG: disulfide reductase [bacterium]|nr:disulfide reductase [bacterium]
MRYAFYPGCSLESSSVAYDLSTRAVAQALGVRLFEIDDWNCCGATEYASMSKLAGCAVIARNLARVDPTIDTVVAPCSACFLNLKKTDRLMVEDPVLSEQINQALAAGDLHYEPGRVNVRSLLDVLVEDVGEQAIRERATRGLNGLRIAPYYGCQIVRPLDGFDDPEHPAKLDRLLGWLGAEVVDYPVKSHCCGGHMAQISEEQAFELIRRLLQSAKEYDADVIATLCPMCQLNLDAYQGRVNNFFNAKFDLPVLFFSQFVGLALGLDADRLGLGKEIVSARPVIERRLAAAQAEV